MKTLYRASRVHTLSYPAMGEWVLVDGRHIERVGVGEVPRADRTVDLPGTTILPGFVDSHVHLTGPGSDPRGERARGRDRRRRRAHRPAHREGRTGRQALVRHQPVRTRRG